MTLVLNWTYLKIRKLEAFLIPFVVFAILTMLAPALLLSSYSFQSIASSQWENLSPNIFYSFVLSIFVSLCALLISLIIAFPLAVLIWYSCSSSANKKLLLLLSFPLISNYFIKLIGLKSCFDFFNGQLNSTYGAFYTIIGLVYLSLPLIIYNFINTLSSLPKERNWAIRDLGQTFWGELFFLLIPWSKTTFISSSMMFFLPSLFTTFISEFLNHDPSSQLIGEVISNISIMALSTNNSRPFISLLVSLLFLIAIFGIVFGVAAYKACLISLEKARRELHLKTKKALLRVRAKENFGGLKQLF